MLILRQSTAIDIRMGPFVDATDGVTPETGITLAGADQAEVLKENGAATVAMAGTFAAVTGADGWYDYTVATGDVDTVGEVVFVVQDSSVCLPVYVRGFVVEEAVYDALYDGGAAGPLLASSAPTNFGDLSITATTGRVDVGAVSGDATAADNLEAMYDGTGYTDDSGPSSRAQVDAISVTGSAANVSPLASPNGFVLTTGTEVNNEDSVVALDGTRHELTDAAGTLDCYYIIDVGGSDVPTSVTFTGVFNGGNDNFDIFVNTGSSGTPTWSQRGTISGTNNASNVSHTFVLFAGDKLTDDSSRVWVRIQATGLTSSSFDVDQVFVSKSISTQSVGYAEGAVWLDTAASNTNTESFVDGVADNPVSTIAAALTIATAVGLKRIQVLAGSSFTLTAAVEGYEIVGANYTLALGGQSISGSRITGGTISGVCTGATSPIFEGCIFDAATTIPACVIRKSWFGDMTFTLGTGNYFFNGCIDRATDTAVPSLDFGAAIGNTAVNLHDYAGGIEVQNMGDVGTDTMIVSGFARVTVNANSSGGTLTTVGFIPVTNNGSTTVTEQTLSTTYMRQFMDDGTSTYDRTTHSNQALRDRGDAAWTTGGGGSLTQILNVVPLIPPAIDLANTATWRLGLSLVNSVDDLPTTAEITPGTIDIDRKAQGATSWTSVVSGAACSEAAGLIYYDEVFDSATGYAAGDLIRITFYSQSITADANTHEISDATGRIFYTGILSTAIDANVTQWLGTAVATPTTAGVPEVDVTFVSGTAQTAGDIPALVTTVDTVVDGIQTDLDNATDGLGAIKADTAAALADTNELQTDWADGGRLDVILDARASQASVDTVDSNVDAILVDTGTTIPGTITTLQADTDDIQTRLPAALVGGRMDANLGAISESDTAANNLEASALGIIPGTAQTGTLSTTACTTDLTGYADDELINRQIVFTGGTANGQAATITDYASASGLVTFSGGIATAPANADTFVVV